MEETVKNDKWFLGVRDGRLIEYSQKRRFFKRFVQQRYMGDRKHTAEEQRTLYWKVWLRTPWPSREAEDRDWRFHFGREQMSLMARVKDAG